MRPRKYNMTQESQNQKIYKSVDTCLVYEANPCSWAKQPKMALCSAPSLRRREDSSLDHLRYRDPKELSEWNILKWAQLKPLDQPSQIFINFWFHCNHWRFNWNVLMHTEPKDSVCRCNQFVVIQNLHG